MGAGLVVITANVRSDYMYILLYEYISRDESNCIMSRIRKYNTSKQMMKEIISAQIIFLFSRASK